MEIAGRGPSEYVIGVIDGVSIPAGAQIRVEGARQSGEHARVDYIEIR
jgi:hypothetical protein